MQLEMDFETPVMSLGSLAKGVPDLKVCSDCKEEKPLSDFYKDCTRKDGLRYACKLCSNKRAKKFYQKNRDAIAEKKKEYRQKNRDAIAKAKKEYSQKNWDAIAERMKIWREANSELLNANNASRRALKKQAQPPWLTEDHINQIKVKYKNSKRMKKLTGIEHHVDHIVPLKGENVCGLHVPWNLQVIPAKHNLEKRNHFDDWNLNDG